MVNVDDYLRIRLLHRDGLSIRQIARRLGHGRETVKKALASPAPPCYTRSRPAACPKLGPYTPAIDRILAADIEASPKQRHTAMRLFERLRDEYGYGGAYDQVRRYIKARRLRQRETHLMLDHPPGSRLECDFGHIHVDFPDGRRLVPVLLCVWSYSHYPFAVALPSEKTEAILHGMLCALEFFGCVPLEVWWDNPKTVAPLVLPGRDRRLNPYCLQLASHYRFAPVFCLPAKGQEKSDVERTVFALQRRFATPVPDVADVDALDRHLLACCLRERQRTVRGRSETIGRMFARERHHAVELPARPFDCGTHALRQADKYQTVMFDDVRYSVPRQAAFGVVTVRAYLDQVVLVHQDRVVACHGRSRAPGTQVLDPKHFLAVLERKPAYLDHTRLFKDLALPPAFALLRERLSDQFGPRTGARHYIRLLQLLVGHNTQAVAAAIEACMTRSTVRADLIERRLLGPDAAAPRVDPSIVNRVHVPPPDLRRFDELLRPFTPREDIHERDAAEAQPQEPAAADDAGAVRQALA